MSESGNLNLSLPCRTDGASSGHAELTAETRWFGWQEARAPSPDIANHQMARSLQGWRALRRTRHDHRRRLLLTSFMERSPFAADGGNRRPSCAFYRPGD